MKIFIIILALVAWSCSRAVSQTRPIPPRTGQQLQLDIPKDIWEPIFFKSIDERANLDNLKSLRLRALPDGDLEIRVWHGFGLTLLEGFVLKRSAGKWSAIHLDGIMRKAASTKSQRQLSTPKSGWDVCWRRLEQAGLPTLPDASAIGCSAYDNDGMSYVVELNRDGVYRTYMYDNPDYAKCKEAKQMIQIGNIISEEFGVPEMGTRQNKHERQ